jgi:RecJ-like exonuclease
MIAMTLSEQDASFLLREITRRAQDIERELVHTDARDMQRDLANELKRIEGIRRELARVTGPTVGVTPS